VLDQSPAIVLPGTEGAEDPFFSPDGQWIGFFADGRLKKAGVQGGAAVVITEEPAVGARGAWWKDDGDIIATLDLFHVFRVPAGGGKAEPLAVKPDDSGYYTFRWPQALPGGDALLVTASKDPGAYEDADLAAVPLPSGKPKVLGRRGYFGRYLPSGHLIYVHQGSLFAVRFDPKRLETSGTPIPVLSDIAGNSSYGGGQLDFSQNGTLVYLSGKGADLRQMTWMDAFGRQIPLLQTQDALLFPRLSPDGTRLIVSVNGRISVYDIARGAMSRVTFGKDPGAAFPVWAPDGRHLAYRTLPNRFWWSRADGSAPPVPLFESSAIAQGCAFSPDGRSFVFSQSDQPDHLWSVSIDLSDPDHPKAGRPERFLGAPAAASEMDPSFSPDGRWLAYASNESGAMHVYVRPFRQSSSGKWQVSTVNGRFPIWSRNGRELFYLTLDGHIMVADYTAAGEAFSPGTPRRWSETQVAVTGVYQPVDLAPDGKRFLVFPMDRPDGNATVHVTFLLNFFDELKRRLP
jgi:serine/threonine-protein kinase